MKSYYAPQQFCLVGKAWEVQYYLRKFTENSANKWQPLATTLNARTNSSPRIRSILFSSAPS